MRVINKHRERSGRLRTLGVIAAGLFLAFAPAVWPVVFSSLRGIVHDPDHRPIAGAQVTVKAAGSDYAQTLTTKPDGSFETVTLPIGEYRVTVTHPGFQPSAQEIVVSSREAPVLHFQLVIGVTS